MIKRIVFAVVAVLLPFTVAACGVDSGIVYDKTYEPARTWTEEEPDYQYTCEYGYDYNPMTGKYEFGNICKTRQVGYKTVEKHEPECYRIKFKNEDGDKGSDCVGPEKYETLGLGDWYEK